MLHNTLLLSLFLQLATSLNILIYAPQHFHSHINFISNVRDALVDAGHNVTELVPYYDPAMHKYGHRESRELRIPITERARENLKKMDKSMSNIWQMDQDRPWHLAPAVPALAEFMSSQCDETLNYPGLLESLKNDHFDVGFTEQFDYCGIGIMHHIGVKALITTSTSSMTDHLLSYIGAPHALNWVPATMGPVSDKMNLKDRFLNILSFFYERWFFNTLACGAQKSFEKKFGAEFPNLLELNSQASLVVTNADPIVDFPRPTLHKIIDVGGIGFSTSDHSKPLNEHFTRILSLRPHTVLISFGSVAKSVTMPPSMRATILRTFAKFPNTTFIWKYEDKTAEFAKGVDNVVLEEWVPQKQIFASGKIQMFITHGGMGSVSEAMRSAIPLIVVPLFADQARNSKMAEKHGCAVIVNKKDITEGGISLEEAILEIKQNTRYLNSSHRISEMFAKRPFSPQELLTRNVEFAGTFGYLDNWDPQSRHMNFIELHQIDLILLICFIIFTPLYVLYRLLRSVVRIVRKNQTKEKLN